MSVKILRWKGGAGGDMVMKMITASASVKSNVNFFPGLTEQGAIKLDLSGLDFGVLRQIDRISLSKQYMSAVDPELLKQELDELANNEEIWWLKSHYYEQEFFINYVIDIVVDPVLLPFVVAANVGKIATRPLDFNVLMPKVKDPTVQYQYAMYNIAKDTMIDVKNDQVIELTQILEGWLSLKQTLIKFDIVLDDKLEILYNNWIQSNKKYMPTSVYQDLVKTKNYDIEHPVLNLIEKYCLLVLSGNKFRLLDYHIV